MSDDEAQRAVYEFWNSNSEECSRSFERMMSEDGVLTDIVDSLFPNVKGLDVLDVGSGGGYSSIVLSSEGHHVTSIDISPLMLEAAKRDSTSRGAEVNFLLDDIQRSNLPDGSFDLVLFYETLFTIADISCAMAEAVRLLRPGGRILIIDGNYFQDQKIERYKARKDFFKMKYGVFEMQLRPEFFDLDYDRLERTVEPLYVSRVIHPGWEVWNFLDMGLEDLRIDTLDTEEYIRVTPTGKSSVALSYMISARKPFYVSDQQRNIDDCEPLTAIDDTDLNCTVPEKVFSVLSGHSRLVIIQLLLASPMNVRRLTELTGESQALTSYNLRLLKECGIVDQQRNGRETVYYIVNPPLMRSMLRMTRYLGSKYRDTPPDTTSEMADTPRFLDTSAHI